MTAVMDKEHNNFTCGHCGGKNKVPFDDIATATVEKTQSWPTTELDALTGKIDKLAEKIEGGGPKNEKKVKYPSFIPGEYCADGNCPLGGVHPNENYNMKPGKQCKNCDQLAPKGAGRCAWCDKNEFDDIPDSVFEERGIKVPKVHTHEH